MGLLITILGAISAVFIVVLIHEWGHFLVAKWMNVQVLRFSIGFGKALWKHNSKSGTEYRLAWLPLGGYVKMLDSREDKDSPDLSKAFDRQPLYKRMAIVLAGPVMNFILAVLCFWLIYLSGVTTLKPIIGQVTPHSVAEQSGLMAGDQIIKVDGHLTKDWEAVLNRLVDQLGHPEKTVLTVQNQNNLQTDKYIDLSHWKISGKEQNPLEEIGITPFEPAFPAIVAKVLPNSPAEKAGINPQDHLLAINNKLLKDWPNIAEEVKNRPNQEIVLKLDRQDNVLQKKVVLGSQIENAKKMGYLGVEVAKPIWPQNMLLKQRYNGLTAWSPALQQTVHLVVFNVIVLGKMIGGNIGLSTLGGPITIFKTAGEASQAGLKTYINFIAFISVTLGFINILPIPGLDGGHFLFQVIEGIIRRPLPEVYQSWLIRIGILLIIFLILQGTVNDLLRLF